MRKIEASKISSKVKELFLQANFNIGTDVLDALEKAWQNEKSKVGKDALKMIIDNNRLASSKELAICQDTGLAVLFVEIGQEVCIVDGDYKEAINKGVEEAYEDGYLRKSVVDDPVFDRKNTKNNTPAFIYNEIIPGDKIKILVMPKGFGSENMSSLAMLTAAHGAKGVVDFIVDTVRKAGPNPCPPTVLGVGVGGTADKAMVIAKKAIARTIGQHNPNPKYAQMEEEALERINKLGIGPGGLGGSTTSLAVNIDYLPTHIAGMPVAVNVCCHATRHAYGEI
ncbi:MAG: fumarate hydratase [Candidatus Caldatribacteriota bacterium]|jgi:fumarate hydratase subunit alpha|nr:fumarate hydratase [Atribacterota bacterium]MDD4288091.1 fumarate hydratase [Atribacterota bacterium]MDD4765025.1 fumarate hydratase [Atribacterota bacterium]